jgi:hypothetical protein
MQVRQIDPYIVVRIPPFVKKKTTKPGLKAAFGLLYPQARRSSRILRRSLPDQPTKPRRSPDEAKLRHAAGKLGKK